MSATVRQPDSMAAVRKVLETGGEWKLLSELHLVNTVQYPVGEEAQWPAIDNAVSTYIDSRRQNGLGMSCALIRLEVNI